MAPDTTNPTAPIPPSAFPTAESAAKGHPYTLTSPLPALFDRLRGKRHPKTKGAFGRQGGRSVATGGMGRPVAATQSTALVAAAVAKANEAAAPGGHA